MVTAFDSNSALRCASALHHVPTVARRNTKIDSYSPQCHTTADLYYRRSGGRLHNFLAVVQISPTHSCPVPQADDLLEALRPLITD